MDIIGDLINLIVELGARLVIWTWKLVSWLISSIRRSVDHSRKHG